MRQTAQQKFNAYLDECQATSDAIRELETQSRAHRGEYSYAFACGVYAQMLKDVIMELPRARREDYRKTLLNLAQREANQVLVDTEAV